MFIITPFHNIKPYFKTFKRNIASILELDSVEMILVNDHSDDTSNQLMTSEFNKKGNVSIISCESEGVSAARNFGLNYLYENVKNYTNSWVTFCDFDDYIEKGLIVGFRENPLINKYDYVLFGYSTDRLQLDHKPFFSVKPFEGVDLGALAIEGPFREKNRTYNLNSPWGRLIKLDFLRKNKIFFDEKLTFREDLIFNLTIFAHSPKAGIILRSYYYYYLNPNSVVHSYIKNVIQQNRLAYINIKKFTDKMQDEVKKNLRLEFLKNAFIQSIFVFVLPKGRHNKYFLSKKRFKNLRMDAIFEPLWRTDIDKSFKNKMNKLLFYLANKRLFLPIYVMIEFHNFILRKKTDDKN